jgi:hypothetical protein
MVPPASEDGATRQPPRMVPPVSSPTAGSPKQCHPSVRCAAKLVPPVSPEGPTGATRDPAHQLVPPVGSSPAGSVGKPETVPPASSTASCASPTQCHPSVRRGQLVPPASPEGTDSSLGPVGRPVGATRQSEGANWCHPSVRTGPTGATRRFVSGRVSRQARNSATRQFGEPPTRCHQPPSWCHPSDCPNPTGATRRFVSSRVREEARNSATRQCGSPPIWCHPPVWRRQMQAWCHPPIRGAEVASSRRTCPPRVAPVRPPWSLPGPHPTPLTVLAGDPERKVFRLLKPSSPAR